MHELKGSAFVRDDSQNHFSSPFPKIIYTIRFTTDRFGFAPWIRCLFISVFFLLIWFAFSLMLAWLFIERQLQCNRCQWYFDFCYKIKSMYIESEFYVVAVTIQSTSLTPNDLRECRWDKLEAYKKSIVIFHSLWHFSESKWMWFFVWIKRCSLVLSHSFALSQYSIEIH